MIAQFLKFASVGVAEHAALRRHLPRFPANLAAVAPVTLATFAANRLWTFSQRPHSRLTAPPVTFMPWTR